MKIIYQVFNPVKNNYSYICDSQTTADEGTTAGYANISVGTTVDADALLKKNQIALLQQQNSLFTVNLEIPVEGGVKLIIIDLTQEQINTDKVYYLLDPTTGINNEAVGLENAQQMFAQIQQNYLNFYPLISYATLTGWAKKPISTGTQTI